MTPGSRHATNPLANYRVSLPLGSSGGEIGRDLAIAWAALAAWRDTAGVAHRITVLRPCVIPDAGV